MTYRPALAPLGEFRYWNRLLGPRGLLHQQCVFPIHEAPRLLEALLADCRQASEPPCLASVKVFGSRPPVGLLSFPREGFTIALDFANRGDTTRRLLRRLEARVLEAGGAIYPAKDSTMSQEGFRRGFPAWERFVRHIDPRFSSSFWRRIDGIECGKS
jgi:FAD/FMN-containing dehydrogenase